MLIVALLVVTPGQGSSDILGYLTIALIGESGGESSYAGGYCGAFWPRAYRKPVSSSRGTSHQVTLQKISYNILRTLCYTFVAGDF